MNTRLQNQNPLHPTTIIPTICSEGTPSPMERGMGGEVLKAPFGACPAKAGGWWLFLLFFYFSPFGGGRAASAQWVAQMHSTVSGQSICLATDDEENVYVAGIYDQSLYLFSNGKAINIENAATVTGNTLSVAGFVKLAFPANNNVFLAKYTKDGELKWAQSLGQVNAQAEPKRNYLSLQVDKSGNSYLFGYWQANTSFTGFETTSKKPGLIKYNTFGDTVWIKYASPASSIFEGYLEKSEKDEELVLNFSATTAFTFGGEAFTSGGKTFAIQGDGTQRLISDLPGASPLLVYPCGNTIYKYGNNEIYRDSANTVGRTVLSITGGNNAGDVQLVKLAVDSLGYITGVGKFKAKSITVAGQAIANSRPTLPDAWDVFAFKIQKGGQKVWVRNILSWETGTGNGYIGMAVDGEGGFNIFSTFKNGMSEIGQGGATFNSTSAGFTIIDYLGQTRGSISYSNRQAKMDILNYSRGFNKYLSTRHKGSINIDNTNINFLSQIGNGVLIIKFRYETPPPPQFSTKFLYCVTVASPPSVTGIGAFQESATIEIYPNPSEGSFSIVSSIEQTTIFSIYNILGIEMQKGEFKTEKNVSIYSKGLHYIKLKIGTKQYTQKIVID